MLTRPPAKEFTEEMKIQKQAVSGQPDLEIEVTPEMIEAGLDIYFDWEAQHDYLGGSAALDSWAECLVRHIYKSMASLSPCSIRNSSNS